MGAMVSELSAEDTQIYRRSIFNLTNVFHQNSEFLQLIENITRPSDLSLLDIQQILFQHINKTFEDKQLTPCTDATTRYQTSHLGILAAVALQENTFEATTAGQQASDYCLSAVATTKEQTFELADNPEGTTSSQEKLFSSNFIPEAPTVGQQFGFHDGSAATPNHDIMAATGGQQTFDFGGNPSAAARSHEQGASFIDGPAAFGFPPATFDPFMDDPAAHFIDDPAAFVFMDDPAAFVFMDDPAAFVFMNDPAAFVFMDDPAAFVFMNDVAAMATTQEHALDINNPADAAAGQQASGSQEMGTDNMDALAPAVTAVTRQPQMSPINSMRRKCSDFALDFEQQQDDTQEFLQCKISEWTEDHKCFWGGYSWSGLPTRDAICSLFKSIHNIDNAEILIPIQRRLHLVIARSFQERLVDRITYLVKKGTVVPIQSLNYRSIAIDIISEVVCDGNHGDETRERVARQVRSGERYKSFTNGMLLSLGKVKAKLIEQVSNDKFNAIVEYCGYISNEMDASSHDSNLGDDTNSANEVDKFSTSLDKLQRALLEDMIIEEGDIDELIESSWPSIIRRVKEKGKKRKRDNLNGVNNPEKRSLNSFIKDKHVATSVAIAVA